MKIKKRNFIIIFIIIFLIIIAYFSIFYKQKDPYQFKENTLDYSKNRGKVDYEKILFQENKSFNIYKINFQSKNFLDYKTRIYGLLFMPKLNKKVPGLVYLPGGGVKKEGLIPLSSKIAEKGYAVLVIDQRGIGETGGHYLNFEQDYQIFSQEKEPIQHLSVYDGLKTYDVLKEVKGIDKDNIAIIGESMGGRYAIITAAIEKRLNGAIIISASGFHIQENPFQVGNNYLVSIDPGHYVNKISPNYLMMLQGDNDTVTKLEDAQKTFSLAKEPKRFFIAEGCSHGFCEEMWPELEEDLNILFKK